MSRLGDSLASSFRSSRFRVWFKVPEIILDDQQYPIIRKISYKYTKNRFVPQG